MKRLLVNADDLGRTEAINRGIVWAHLHGIVSSATVMVGYEAARSVADYAVAYPRLGLGLHLTLTGGRPTLDPASVPSLVDRDGFLARRPDELRDPDPDDILREFENQLRLFREITGQNPTHFDSHHHVHARPEVLGVVVTLARRHGLPVRSSTPLVRQELLRAGVPTPDHFFDGFYATGATREHLLDLLSNLPAGTSELMCHPGHVDSELRAGSTYLEDREREIEILTDPEVRRVVRESGYELIHYGEL